MASERVQKILARAGLASRRKAEELITEGLVTINGKIAKLGDKADMATDAIKIKGKLLLKVENRVYYAFHKPKGVISSLADPDGRPTIKDYLKYVTERVFPVGRLDFNSDGLILLTNDGDFAEKLQRAPKIARVYEVKVKGHPTSEDLERLRSGIHAGRKHVEPFRVRLIGELQKKARVEVVFTDPGVIDIKTFFEDKGFLVERVTRKAIGQITLHSRDGLMGPGGLRQLTYSQVEALLTHPDLGLKRLDEDRELEKKQEKIEVKTFRTGASGGRRGFAGAYGAGRDAYGEAGHRSSSKVVIRLKGERNSVSGSGGEADSRDEDEGGFERGGDHERAPRGIRTVRAERDSDREKAARGPRIERGGSPDRAERGARSEYARGGIRGPRADSERGGRGGPMSARSEREYGVKRAERGGARGYGAERGPRKAFGAPERPLGPKPFGRSKPRAERSEGGFGEKRAPRSEGKSFGGKSEFGRYEPKPKSEFKARSEGDKPRFGAGDRPFKGPKRSSERSPKSAEGGKSTRRPSFGLTKKRTRD